MTGASNAIITKSDHLDDLAALVRNEHRLAQDACANALAHGMNAGDVLMEAKSRLAKHEWRTWLKSCQIATSTARLYQQLACHRPEIEAAIKGGTELSLRGARRLISKPCPRKAAPKSVDSLETLWNRATAEARSVFLDTIGVAAILENMSPDFGRDLRSRMPGPRNKPASDRKRRPTLSLTKTTDASGRSSFA
jgi:hypothetical protein